MALPAHKVYCGHEYTENNLRFAMSVEPNNAKLIARYERVKTLRAGGTPTTVPATMEEEAQTNPFLRWDSAEFRRASSLLRRRIALIPCRCSLRSEK